MHDIAPLAGLAAGALALVAYIPYVVSILRGNTKPNRATWFIWAVIGAILGASYYASGAEHTAWVTVGYFLGPTDHCGHSFHTIRRWRLRAS